MIQVVYVRHLLTVVAIHIPNHDLVDVFTGFGLTQRGALKDLLKSMDKYYAKEN
jgi:hypothetical protein